MKPSWKWKWMPALLLPAMATVVATAAAAAEMYVCGDRGDVEYRDDARGRDCRRGAQAQVGTVSGNSGDRGRAATPGVSMHPGDDDAQAALRARLAVERGKLEALRREYNGGQPERRGDERNYAKYQARTDALKSALEESRLRVEALQRQLQP